MRWGEFAATLRSGAGASVAVGPPVLHLRPAMRTGAADAFPVEHHRPHSSLRLGSVMAPVAAVSPRLRRRLRRAALRLAGGPAAPLGAICPDGACVRGMREPRALGASI